MARNYQEHVGETTLKELLFPERISRGYYWFISLIYVVWTNVANAIRSVMLGDFYAEDETLRWGVVLSWVAAILAHVIMYILMAVRPRLVDLGVSRNYGWIALIPPLNSILLIMCFVFPSGAFRTPTKGKIRG